jgi:uncharacterized protein YpmS
MSDGTITLDAVMKSLATLELLYPKKRIAKYMKMCKPTYDAVLTRIRPCEIDIDGMPTEQLMALNFSGIEMRVDDAVPDGTVKIYNANDELIQECRL